MPQLLWRQSEKGILPHLQGTTPTIATYISALYIHFLKASQTTVHIHIFLWIIHTTMNEHRNRTHGHIVVGCGFNSVRSC
jgi:hypothetical protein